ncbi:MAG: PilW family protein [Acidimicrobiia bacterium]
MRASRRRARRIFSPEDGLTILELMVAAAVSMISIAIVTTWMIAATRVDIDQDADFDGLNELRLAKAQMVREIRFATGSVATSTPDSIEVWVDLDGSGGAGPDSAGEHVIWRIIVGDLVRLEDDDMDTAVTWVEDLDTSNSSLTLTGSVVDIELSLVIEQGASDILESRTIKTRVELRNA